MSRVLDDLLDANRRYASDFGGRGALPMQPRRRVAILTCMDARLDPARFAGLGEGDAHIIRNAGGRASADAIRSLVVSWKLHGTREWLVVHHTDCELQTVTDRILGDLLASSLRPAARTADGWRDPGDVRPGSRVGRYVRWLTIRNMGAAVLEDVQHLRRHALVPPDIAIYGYVYDVRCGRLIEVPGAAEAGRRRTAD
jgi:carbonic anhydrase